MAEKLGKLALALLLSWKELLSSLHPELSPELAKGGKW